MRSCPLCSNSDKLSYLWDTQIVRCPVCTLGYMDMLPTVAELAQMYASDFWQGDASYADYVRDKGGLQRNFQERIAKLLEYNNGGKLYEAGCAHGFFLELAREHWDVFGSDISEEAIDYARNTLHLSVEVGDFESSPPEPNTYDIVAMWDTIEHLYDPMLAVKKSAEALKSGGILALTTGDIGGVLPRIQRRSWRLIHPTHLYYFSRSSVTRLLNDNGLDVVHFSYVGNWRSLRQMARVLTFGRQDESWRNKLLRQVERLPFIDRELPVNTYDVMFVIAQKSAK